MLSFLLSSVAESIQKILFCSTQEKSEHFYFGIGIMDAKLDETQNCYHKFQGKMELGNQKFYHPVSWL
jgi:hypothetical protein